MSALFMTEPPVPRTGRGIKQALHELLGEGLDSGLPPDGQETQEIRDRISHLWGTPYMFAEDRDNQNSGYERICL